MKIGYIGLGKMGKGMVALLLEKGHTVSLFDRDAKALDECAALGATVALSLEELARTLDAPKIIWLMVPHESVDEVIEKLLPHLISGDVLIDGGNSFYKDSIRRAETLEKAGVHFLDVGVSGGPRGAREGACIMVGGKKEIFLTLQFLFEDLAAPNAYGYMGEAGAGHFVKMVHNGIEYGMMQALAEGFAILKKSPFALDLEQVADLYNHKSVIESRLVGWLRDAYKIYGADLEGISTQVAHTGEGAWMIEAARELGVPVSVIERALEFRIESGKNPSYTGAILSALRNQFGGHDAAQKS